MRSRTPLPARERGHFVPFAGAAALFAALCIFARTAALVLAAAIAAPLPLAQTVLWLGRQGAGQQAASVQAQSAPETAPEAAASSLPGRRRRTLPPRSKTRCPLPLKRTAPTRRCW